MQWYICSVRYYIYSFGVVCVCVCVLQQFPSPFSSFFLPATTQIPEREGDFF